MTSPNSNTPHQTCKFCGEPLHIHESLGTWRGECVNTDCAAYMITNELEALATITQAVIDSHKRGETPHIRRGASPNNPFNGRTFG